MSPILVSSVVLGYFIVLMIIARVTGKGATSQTYFTGNRQSPWYLVAFGMIGATLSGVTFISVPGEVGNTQFGYFQVVLGYIVGYLVIGTVLLPLYYRMNLVSIYEYLSQRLGFSSYKTGAIYFLISRVIGASFRLFLVSSVLQLAFFDAFNIPFEVTVFIAIALIWLYTFQGGIKTIVWTDTLQTAFMLISVGICIYQISRELDFGDNGIVSTISASGYADIFVWDWQSGQNFFKQFFSGAFITIVMTGLDQDMMQKNLTCRSIGDAKKNMFSFTITLVLANLFFLSLGVMLYLYANAQQIPLPERSDELFPMIALNYLSPVAGIFFLLGITAAAYSSADSALTSLTTSFCVDILQRKKDQEIPASLRMKVQLGFSVLLYVVILLFNLINDQSIITSLFTVAGYTYGPLLGLFTFGIFTRKALKDKYVPIVCILSPVICYIINDNSEAWFNGYRFGFEMLILNGALTFLGLQLLSEKKKEELVTNENTLP
jgi:Na+/proline symporter